MKLKFVLLILLSAVLFSSCGKELTLNKGDVLFEIKKGESIHGVTKRLKMMKIIGDTTRFEVFAKLTHKNTDLKYGVYQIQSRMDYSDLLDKFYSGQTYSIRVTIPEGSTLLQIADILADKNLVKKDEFLSLCTNTNFISELGLKTKSLEGYLFPDTYLIPQEYKKDEIIKMMVDNFHKNVDSDLLHVIQKRGLDLNSVLIMASIVEKEAKEEFEKPIISGVYYNRLKRGMLLEADPTLIYGLEIAGVYTGEIRYRDFNLVSPYNTYRYPGLPPTPIANPGKTAILAAIYPAQTDYLFFVAKNDGTHYFSRTREEHNQAVYQYQRLPAIQKRKAALKE